MGETLDGSLGDPDYQLPQPDFLIVHGATTVLDAGPVTQVQIWSRSKGSIDGPLQCCGESVGMVATLF